MLPYARPLETIWEETDVSMTSILDRTYEEEPNFAGTELFFFNRRRRLFFNSTFLDVRISSSCRHSCFSLFSKIIVTSSTTSALRQSAVNLASELHFFIFSKSIVTNIAYVII
jgi:hypothetical protein